MRLGRLQRRNVYSKAAETLVIVCHHVCYVTISYTDQEVLNLHDDLDVVLNALHEVRAKWHFLGGSLGVKEADLAAIRAEFRDIPNECLQEMLSHWLQVDPQPCWNAIVAALRKRIVDEPQLALALETKYCPGGCIYYK